MAEPQVETPVAATDALPETVEKVISEVEETGTSSDETKDAVESEPKDKGIDLTSVKEGLDEISSEEKPAETAETTTEEEKPAEPEAAPAEE